MSTAQDDNTTTGDSIKKKRAQLNHLLLDFNFPEKDKIVQLEAVFGPAGCWYFTCLLCEMTHATDGEISKVKALKTGSNHSIVEAEKILAWLIKQEMIFVNGDKISNSRVIKDQESCADKRQRNANKQKEYREREQLRNGNVTVTLPATDPVTSVTATATVLDPVFSSLKIVKKLSSLTDDALAAVHQWAAHRRKLSLPFDEEAANCLQKDYSGRSEDLIRNVSWSIQNGWRTVRVAPAPDVSTRGGPAKTAPAARNQETTIESMRKIFEGGEL